MNGGGGKLYKASEDSTHSIIIGGMSTDDQYAATYGLTMAAGEYLGRDTTKLVINESAAKELGWKEASMAVGQPVKSEGSPNVMTIAGVVKDFHFDSKHVAISPMFMMHIRNTTTYRYLSFKVKPGNMAKTIAGLEQKWATVLPGAPFDYKFMDDTLGFMYRSDIQLKQAAQTATLLALVIVLLGVLGVVTLSITRRMKEVGVRKVWAHRAYRSSASSSKNLPDDPAGYMRSLSASLLGTRQLAQQFCISYIIGLDQLRDGSRHHGRADRLDRIHTNHYKSVEQSYQESSERVKIITGICIMKCFFFQQVAPLLPVSSPVPAGPGADMESRYQLPGRLFCIALMTSLFTCIRSRECGSQK